MRRTPLIPGEDPLRIGGYWLAGRLGAGGQGVVYEAYGADGTRVALKALRADGPFGRLTRREVDAARRVAPFCTARVLFADLEGERPYIVTEFVEGPSLRAAVTEHGPLPAEDLYRLAVGMVTAITAIHQAGVVHRDLKPANVLLGPYGPRVIDFGVARILDDSATLSHGVAGTLRYMAPEQFRGRRAGRAADVHAWAAVLLYAATGRHAFAGETNGAIMESVRRHVPDPGVLPPGLREPVAASLAKDPRARPTAAELLAGLVGGGAVDGTPARVPEGPRGQEPGASTEPLSSSVALAGEEGEGDGEDDAGEDGAAADPDPVGLEGLLQAGRGRAAHPPAVDGASPPGLGGAAEDLYRELPEGQRSLMAQLLLRMIEPEPGGGLLLREVTLADLPEGDPREAGAVVDRLAEAGLVERDGERVHLDNAALTVAWSRLRRWLDEEGDGLRLLARVGAAVRFWRDHGEREGDLLQGSLLDQTLAWVGAGRGRVPLNAVEHRFLEAGRLSVVRRERRRRTVTAVLASMVAVLLVASGGLVWLNRERTQERDHARTLLDEALSRDLAARSNALSGEAPQTAMLLAAAAWRFAPTVEARAAVHRAAAQPEVSSIGDLGAVAQQVVLSADGRRAAGVAGTAVRVWDIDAGEVVGEVALDVPEGVEPAGFSPTGIALSSDGETVAVMAHGVGVRFYSVADGEPLDIRAPIDLDRPTVPSPYFAGGDAYLLLDQDDVFPDVGHPDLARGGMRLIDLATGEAVIEGGDRALDIAVAEQADVVAVYRGAGEAVEIVDPATGETRARVWEEVPGGFVDLALSPDGRVLAGAMVEGGLLAWDLHSEEPLTTPAQRPDMPLTADGSRALGLRFGADGGLLAEFTGDRLRLWESGERLEEQGRSEQGWLPEGWEEPGSYALSLSHRLEDRGVRDVVWGADGDRLRLLLDTGTVTTVEWPHRVLVPADTEPGEVLDARTTGLETTPGFLSPDGEVALRQNGGDLEFLDGGTLEPLGPPVLGGEDYTDAVGVTLGAFTADSRLAAIVQPIDSGWKTDIAKTLVQLWHVPTRTPLGPPVEGPEIEGTDEGAIAFVDSDSRLRLAISGMNGEEEAYEMPVAPGLLVDDICQRVGRDLSDTEWRTHLDGVERRKVC